MLWKKGRRSDNVEDRRQLRLGGPRLKLSVGTLAIVLLIGVVLGENPLELLALLTQGGGRTSFTAEAPPSPEDDEAAQFVSAVLADTEDTWGAIFPGLGEHYREPKLVLFTDQVASACGFTSSATGPFYCPGDQKVYLDLGFFRELDRLGAPGDFAQAYVIGHEVGHHVQNLLGISGKVHALQVRSGSAQANALSVLLELQADCFAGVWAHHADKYRSMLEPGDVDEGLNAASAIGDDRLLRRAGQSVSPESFTHGSSQQRAFWLRKGMESGDIASCDTFSMAAKK
ncbi:KPN_02809 family neutral zinc metallopeptidase [Methylosarcina fibrata]|uniref:KPN_02809 family neutral zinc metallopeptidase n=1 Tax=Methylosarcina fibrata TaxID=105972 RepID=UPI000372E863|nr:neutral zinc metallopeptidase [Methylosarcina fibrata]